AWTAVRRRGRLRHGRLPRRGRLPHVLAPEAGVPPGALERRRPAQSALRCALPAHAGFVAQARLKLTKKASLQTGRPFRSKHSWACLMSGKCLRALSRLAESGTPASAPQVDRECDRPARDPSVDRAFRPSFDGLKAIRTCTAPTRSAGCRS